MLGQIAWTLGGLALCALAAWRLETGLQLLIVAACLRSQAMITLGPVRVTWFSALLAVTIAGWLLREGRTGFRAGAPLGPLAWALALVPAAGFWSLYASHDREKSLAYAGSLLALLALSWLFARLVADRELGRRIAAVFVVSSVLLASIAVFQVLFPSIGLGNVSLQGINLRTYMIRSAAFYLDPNFLGAHLTVAVALAIGLAADAEYPRARRWWIAASLACGVGVALTYGRTAWLALVLGLVVLVLALPKGTKRIPGIMLGVILIAAMLALPIVKWRFVTGATGASSTTRALMLRSSAKMLADHPVTGVGLEGFQAAYPPYRDPGALAEISHPHEVPVAFVAETGIAGLIAEVLLAVAIVVTILRRRRNGSSGYDAALLAAFLGLLFGTLFQFYLYFPVMWIVAGLFAAGTGPLRLAAQPTDASDARSIDQSDVARGTYTSTPL